MTPAFVRTLFDRYDIDRRIMDDSVKAWWKDAAERLVWTAVQGALAVLSAQQLGWVDLGDGDLWKAAAAGGLGAALSFLKSMSASRLSAGDTAQLGLKTYSYTEEGPGSAGEAGALSIERILIIVILVILVVFLAVRLL